MYAIDDFIHEYFIKLQDIGQIEYQFLQCCNKKRKTKTTLLLFLVLAQI